MKIKYENGGKPRRKSKRDISTNKTTSAAQNDKQRRVDEGLKVRREDYATGVKGKDAYLADVRASVANRRKIREGFQDRIRTINQDFESGKIDAATKRQLRAELTADKQEFTNALAGSSQGYESEADRQGKSENRATSTINVKKKNGKRITNSTDEANAVRMTKTGADAKEVVERRATKPLIRGDKDKRDVSIDEASAPMPTRHYNDGGTLDPKKKRKQEMAKRDYSRVDPAKLKGKEREEFIKKYAKKGPKKPKASSRPKGFM